MKIGIVIPCYNEENRLNIIEFKNFISLNQDFKFCFVNDGSTDKTLNVIESLHKEFSEKVIVCNQTVNKGKAEAVRLGLNSFSEHESIDFIGYMDADLATPLSELFSIQNLIKNKRKNIIFGSRIIHLGAKVKRNFLRFIFGRIFATIVSRWILKLPIYDTQCGFKFFKKLELLPIISDSFKSKWFFDIEIFKRYNQKYGPNYLVDNGYEYFLETWEDKVGTKITVIDFLKTPIELIKLKLI